jgi:hypothetical protein
MKIKSIKVKDRDTHDRQHRGQGRLFIFHDNESIIDDLNNRHYRPYTVYKKELFPLICEELGVTELKAKWRQTAGCSCPCSPGFILEDNKFRWKNVFVTVK